MTGLAALFFLTAMLYAAVGFGGGSTYISLLALGGVDYQLLPVIALTCNILVVTGGTFRFQLAQLIPWRRVWPILALSVPAAWLGGLTPIRQEVFMVLLGGSLLAAGVLLLTETIVRRDVESRATPRISGGWFAPIAGGAIGYLSGVVGIGGGIFLAPLLLLTRWAPAKQVAATASIFILVNSLGGLAGQFGKSGAATIFQNVAQHWPLFVAVIAGGQIGSYLATRKLPAHVIRAMTALLILYVAIKILWEQWR
ncbi:MAG: sulfite exporter TauE/SafE family protein [Parasphingorhabdus sp.]|nr:sulfite exporter TauE/SafE family protein [Parasphingorhabdus sp.]